MEQVPHVSLLTEITIKALTAACFGVLKKNVYVLQCTQASYYNSESEMVSFPPDIPVLLGG